jgi:hypothetical protein
MNTIKSSPQRVRDGHNQTCRFLPAQQMLVMKTTAMKIKQILMMLTAMMVLLGAATKVQAGATNFTFNVASGTWNTSGNWSPGGIPGQNVGDTATIPTTDTVTGMGGVSPTITTLTINGTGALTVDAGTLTVSGTTTVGSSGAARLTISSGATLSLTGTGNDYGYGGTASTITNNGTFTCSGGAASTTGDFQNNGTVTFPGGSAQSFNGTIAFTNGANASLNILSSSSTPFGGSCTLVATATGNTVTYTNAVSNGSQLATTYYNLTVLGTGTINNWSLGADIVNGTLTISGSYSQGNFSGMTIKSNLVINTTGTVTQNNALPIAGNLIISNGTYSVANTSLPTVTNNIIIGSGGGYNISSSSSGGTMVSSSALQGSATGANTTGTITVASGKSLTLSAGGLAFTAYGGGSTAPLTVAGSAGSLALNSEPVTVTTTTALATGNYTLIATNAAGATVTGTPGALTVNGSGLAANTISSIAVSSGKLILTVSPITPPTITAGPASTTICSNSTATFAVTASGSSPLSYLWYGHTNAGWGSGNQWIASGSGSTYVSSSEGNGGAVGTNYCLSSAGNINSPNGLAWGIYGPETMTRTFPAALTSGQIFQINMENGYVGNGKFGFALTNSTGNLLFSFYFQGGQSDYQYTDSGGTHTTSLPYMAQGLQVTVIMGAGSPASYTLVASTNCGAAVQYTGTFASTGGPDIVGLFQTDTGDSGGNYNAYFNNIIAGTANDNASYYTGGGGWSGVNVGDTTPISGATSSSYLTSTGTSGSLYYAMVYNSYGAVVSTNATLTVNLLSVGGTVTPATSSLCNGSSVTLTNTGSTGANQWFVKTNAGSFFSISGATATNYTTPNLTNTASTNITYSYYATVSNSPCSSVNSTTNVITVSPTSVGGTVHASASSFCLGGSVTLTNTGSLGANQWYVETNAGGFFSISGATSATYGPINLTNNTSSNITYYYYASVSSGPCSAASSTTNAITVNATAAGGTTTAALTNLLSGLSTTLTLSGNTGTNIQWYVATNAGSFSSISGATATNYTTPNLTNTASTNITVYYYAGVTNSPCSSANSTTSAVTVIAAPVITAGPTNTTVCSNSTATFAVTAGGSSLSYAWYQYANAGWGSAWTVTNETGGTIFLGNSTNTLGATTPCNTTFGTYGNINTSSGLSLGLYGGSTGEQAIRTFPAALTSGQIFQINICNGNVDTGQTVGFSLHNTSNANLFSFIFTGGGTQYSLVDGNGVTATSVGFTRTGLKITVIVGAGSPASYTVLITQCGGSTVEYSGTFATTGSPDILLLYNNNNTGADTSISDCYFNSIYAGGAYDNADNYVAAGNWSTHDAGDAAPINGATGSSYSFTASTNGVYYAMAYNNIGAAVSTNATLTVNPLPVVTITPSGSTTYCSGGSVGLTASGASTYGWSPGTGLSATTGASVTASPTTTTTYTVTGTNASGCINTATVTVTVNPLPTAYNVTGGGSYCAGGSGVDVQLSSSDSGVNYQLFVGAAPVGPAMPGTSGQAIDFGNQTTAGAYTVVATNASTGCTATMNGSATVTINPLPTVTITPSGSTTFCSGGSVGLTASGASTYGWSPGTGLSATTGASVTASPTTTTTYTVTGTNASGCVNTTTVTVTVNPLPVVTGQPLNSTNCVGATASFTVTTSDASDFYQWFTNGVALTNGATGNGSTIGGATNATLAYTNVQAADAVTNIYCVLSNTNGCTTTTTNVSLTVNPLPTVTISPSSTNICYGGSATLTANTSASSPSYLWSDSETTPSITVSPASTTSYTVTVTDGTTGCANTSAGATVTVNPLPTVTISPSSTNICSSGSATLTANTSASSPSYLWSDSETTPSITVSPASTTSYTVTVTDGTTGCANTSDSATVTVNICNTSITVGSSENPSGFKDSVFFTASVTPTNATGSVVFLTNGVTFDTETLNATGLATSVATTLLPRGTNPITAEYSGDLPASTNTLNQIVTNHPPVATPMTVKRTAGLQVLITLSDLATNWSDVDGDTVELTGIGPVTTNNVTLMLLNVTTNMDGSYVITNDAYIGYTNSPNVNDQFTYSISDGQGGTNIGIVNIVIVTNVTGQSSITSIMSGNPTTLTAYGIPGYIYITQRATNLVSAVWVNIATNTAATNGVISVTDNFSDLGNQQPANAYYRLSWSPSP